jgi:hypothetical protein
MFPADVSVYPPLHSFVLASPSHLFLDSGGSLFTFFFLVTIASSGLFVKIRDHWSRPTFDYTSVYIDPFTDNSISIRCRSPRHQVPRNLRRKGNLPLIDSQCRTLSHNGSRDSFQEMDLVPKKGLGRRRGLAMR